MHDYVSRVIAALDVPVDRFTDYGEPEKATFYLASVVRLFLYQYVQRNDVVPAGDDSFGDPVDAIWDVVATDVTMFERWVLGPVRQELCVERPEAKRITRCIRPRPVAAG